MPDVTTADMALRLLASGGLGAALGAERELNAQPAGFRTHVLVCLGAALFTVGGAAYGEGDPTRIAAQVASGIGFLGAGAILRDAGGVKGLTTASNLWVTAAVGLACGLGAIPAAAIATAIALLALTLLKRLSGLLFPQQRGRVIELTVDRSQPLREVARRAAQVLATRVDVFRVSPDGEGRTRLVLRARLKPGFVVLDLADELRALPGVEDVDIGSS